MMYRRLLMVVLIFSIGVLLLSSPDGKTGAVFAQQGDATPTLTPSPTPVYYGPTFTPTPTLIPPPEGGGRVRVRELVVRFGPSIEWHAMGGLPYNSDVYPIGRSEEGTWVAIPWQDNQLGWISSQLVIWHPDFNVSDLPVIRPPLDLTITPGLLATQTALAEERGTEEATATLTPSPTLLPSATASPLPAATDTTAPTETQTATLAAAVADAGEDAEESDEGEPSSGSEGAERPSFSLPQIDPRAGMWAGIGVGGILLTIYGWQFITARRDLKRYTDGFPLEGCPVCQTGTLYLEEVTHHPLGIPRVHRTVRCDGCHSVLRQIQPGRWRYMIDPYANPDLADEYNRQAFSDEQLPGFVVDAAAYLPQRMEEVADDDPEQTAIEFVTELEQKFLEERAKMLEEEERAKAEAEAAAKEEAESEDTETEDDGQENDIEEAE